MHNRDIIEPKSALQGILKMNSDYYQLFASQCRSDGKIWTEDFQLRYRFLIAALEKGYSEIISKDMVLHFEEKQTKAPYTIMEFGTAEGKLAKSLLDTIKHKKPKMYNSLDFVCVDFTKEYKKKQEINLKEHISKVQFIRKDALDIENNYHKNIDYVVMNEFLDDLPVTRLWRNSDFDQELFIQSFKKRKGCHSRHCDLDFVPLDKNPQMQEDYKAIKEYFNYLGQDILHDKNIYIGILDLFKQLKNLVAESGKLFVMDYMINVNKNENLGKRTTIEENLRSLDDSWGANNITTPVDYKELKLIGEKTGFLNLGIKDLDSFGNQTRGTYRYFYTSFKKIKNY